jgi:4-amino-4-deoxy-L-arabinose transferase-like glycosyltransferase
MPELQPRVHALLVDQPLTDSLTNNVAEAASAVQVQELETERLAPLLLILLAGLVLRLGVLAWFYDRPPSIWDEGDYKTLARNLVQHGEFSYTPGTPVSIRPPLFPAMVAGVYLVFGLDNYQAVRVIQVVLSLLTVVVLYQLGRAISSRRVALWLAGFCALYPSLISFTGLLLTETLFTLLLCSACYTLVLFYQRGALAYVVATGVLLGLAALTRSVVWMSPPFLALFMVLTLKTPWRRRLLASTMLVAAFALTLAPWMIRCTALEQTLVMVDTMGGSNFLMGNYKHTPLHRSWDAISIKGERSWDREVIAAYPPSERVTQGQFDKLALRQGLKFVRENPWLTFHRDVIKFFDFWGLDRELVAGAGQGLFGPMPKLVVLLLTMIIFGTYAAAMLLGVFGMVLTPLADRRLHWFLLLVIAFICGMHTLVFGHSRYHLPVMPLVMVFSASALVSGRELWQAPRRWSFWLAGSLCAVLVAGWLWTLAAGDLERFMNLMGSLV